MSCLLTVISIVLGYVQDVWMYEVGSSQWASLSGYLYPDDPGFYGTKGIPSINNYPGSRVYSSMVFIPGSSSFIMIGGFGHNSATVEGEFMSILQTDSSCRLLYE
jgi:hypothetical protein